MTLFSILVQAVVYTWHDHTFGKPCSLPFFMYLYTSVVMSAHGGWNHRSHTEHCTEPLLFDATRFAVFLQTGQSFLPIFVAQVSHTCLFLTQLHSFRIILSTQCNLRVIILNNTLPTQCNLRVIILKAISYIWYFQYSY